jgi:endonuclease/exonuclease/phosphatase (EEP) superfamily protein YafD
MSQHVLLAVVLSPYLMAGSLLAAFVLSAVTRMWLLTGLTAVVTVIAMAGQVSFYYAGRQSETRDAVNVRVLSANLRYGLADAHFLHDLARNHADLLAVQELTKEEVRRLSDDGIGVEFPYSVLYPGASATGIGLWSRYPLHRVPLKRVKNVGLIAAQLRIPGVRNDPVFASVHVPAPVPDVVDKWRTGMRRIEIALNELNDTGPGGAVIAAGDFNSTIDQVDYRDLFDYGYQDAVHQSGAGWAPTYPGNESYPPVLTIDHALIRGATATSVETISVPESDHRAILVDVSIPKDPTAS